MAQSNYPFISYVQMAIANVKPTKYYTKWTHYNRELWNTLDSCIFSLFLSLSLSHFSCMYHCVSLHDFDRLTFNDNAIG